MTLLQLLFILLITFVIGCGDQNGQEGGSDIYSEKSGYDDGTYCAEIDYYFSETGTSSTYTLEVEIENNELTKIYWPNGGWLDHSHFAPPSISEGIANFTSDRGVDYTIRILGKEGDCSLDTYATDEDELIEASEEQENWIRQQEEDERPRQEEEEEEQRRRQAEEDTRSQDYSENNE